MQRFQGLKTTSGRGRPRRGVGNQTRGERHLHGDSGRLGETEGGVTGCPDAAQRGFVASRRLCFRLVFHPSPRTQHPGRDAAGGRAGSRLVCETPATRRAWNPGTLAEQTPWGGGCRKHIWEWTLGHVSLGGGVLCGSLDNRAAATSLPTGCWGSERLSKPQDVRVRSYRHRLSHVDSAQGFPAPEP